MQERNTFRQPGASDRQSVFLAWIPATYFGWGVAGLQIALHWCCEGRLLPVMHRVQAQGFAIDPVRLKLLEPCIRASTAFAQQLARAPANLPLKPDVPAVHAMGNQAVDLFIDVWGSSNIGRIVFEDTDFPPHAVSRLQECGVLTVVSRWNFEILRDVTDRPIVVIHEGVDANQFCPGPRSGLWDSSRFYIFSGGKAEYRKGQDLILAAFKIFADRHPESVLVTAWQSPFSHMGVGLQGALKSPLQRDATGRSLDVGRWARENGVDPSHTLEIGLVPNIHMPFILREMDCAICASRAEGGTNSPVMEAMACGVPVILPRNTGMRDLILAGNCLVLEHQSPVSTGEPGGKQGWGESDVEEIVSALEALFASSSLRRQLGTAGMRFIHQRSWKAHAERLAALVTAS